MEARWAKVAAEPSSTGPTAPLSPPPLAPNSPTLKRPATPKPGRVGEPIPPPEPLSKMSKAYKLSRRMEFRGLKISIETDKGEKRHWYDPNADKKGSTTMKYPYGYIRMTKGVDGDHVDVYVGPNEQAKNVYVVNQMKKPRNNKEAWTDFDEQKCMLGFDSAEAAKKAYLAHYNNPRFFGSMLTLPFEAFKKRVLTTLHRPQRLKAASLDQRLSYRRGSNAQIPCDSGDRITFVKQNESRLSVKALWTGAGVDPTSLKTFTDRRLRHTKVASNRSEGPALTTQGRGLHNVPTTRTPVDATMHSLCHQLKVSNRVIQPVAVPVMHNLIGPQTTSKVASHNNTMLQSLLTFDVDQAVLRDTAKRAHVSLFSSRHEPHDNSSSITRQTMKPIDHAYKLGADQAYEDFMKEAQGNLGDPMFWQGGTPPPGAEGEMAPQEGGTAEDAALALPPGIFQGLQMKVNPAGERSTTVKVTPEALGAPDALQGIFAAEPAAKVEMTMPQAGGEGAGGGGGPADGGVPQGPPVDGAGAMPPGEAAGVPPELAGKMAAVIAKHAAKKTRIESESNPDVSKLHPWKSKKTKAERNANMLQRLKL